MQNNTEIMQDKNIKNIIKEVRSILRRDSSLVPISS